MQDPGREEAASSSASSSVTPQSVDQPAPPMAQMGVVASHQHPGALGPPGPTGSAFFGGVPFAGLPPTQPPASQAAGPSGGFQGPSYAAGQVHYSPAALGGPSGEYHGVVYTGHLPQTASGTMHHVPPPGSYAQQITVPQSPAPAAAAACGSPAAGVFLSNLSHSSQCPRALPKSTARSTYKNITDKCGQCNEMKEDMRLFGCSHYPFCNDCIKSMSRTAPSLRCPICRKLVQKTFRVSKLTPDV